MQVPPTIPTLPLCWLACVWHGATFMIDWHNFAYTLMALSMTRRHPLVIPSLEPCARLNTVCMHGEMYVSQLVFATTKWEIHGPERLCMVRMSFYLCR